MSHGPPTKQPWSHPTLYPTEETTVGLMENPKMGRGGRTDVTKGKGGKRKKTARSVDSRQLQRLFSFWQSFPPQKHLLNLYLSRMSERVNGSHPLLLHISLSLSQFLCPFHLSPLFMWQQWQTKMEGRKLCSVGHLEETVWNWNEDDPPTAQSLLTLHMDMFYPGFLLLLAEFHTHTHADTQLPGRIFFFVQMNIALW